MGDPILNCLTTACCPPEQRQEVLAKWLVANSTIQAVQANDVAALILKHFDLAPAGTLTPLVQEIARLARGEGYKA